MLVPKYLRPVRDKKSYEASFGERIVRIVVNWPIVFLLCVPAIAVIASMFLSFGLLFLKLLNVVENAIVAHDWLMLALIALASAAILSLWKLAYVVHRYFII
ncbi:hypothetical protein JET14_21075 (plasmid) [Martelella lutilitoris]|uniref:Uncharacterized protein n=1 Tax=Martelella lutilitoris TaxID=2583532 RepID=A0A7T7HPC9_9HYPH|nr:hypothetical protein [Martelella lutilitoris]QQM32933.1 hypothetical protein JET14_21075 [Martelella lutilitoris]QRX65121.1 hypothetical protein JS578_12875 [Dysgonomonadaceae bacterium zrk40]